MQINGFPRFFERFIGEKGIFKRNRLISTGAVVGVGCPATSISGVRPLLTPQRQYSGHNTPLSHHTDPGPMGLGQYTSLGKYCGPHTASSVFLILIVSL